LLVGPGIVAPGDRCRALIKPHLTSVAALKQIRST
jgi:hypothetical protein